MASVQHRRALAALLALVLVASFVPVTLAADDTTPPVGSLTVNGGNPLTNDPWHVHLDVPATDEGSGVAVIQLKVNGGGPMVLDYQPAMVVELPWWRDGSNTIEVSWQDVAGNLSDPATATLFVDLVAPYAKVSFYDITPGGIVFDVAAQDPADVDAMVFYCEDQTVPAVLPYGARVTVAFGAGGLDCGAHYGMVTVRAGARDAAGNEFLQPVSVPRTPSFSVAISGPAITGQSMTITPILPDDYVLPANGGCRWEFRWGDDASLDSAEVDETYGGLLFDIPAKAGKCPPWTFTLPWVPYRQYDVYVNPFTIENGAMVMPPGAQERFMGAVGTTERRILSSSLPIAQVLPNTYTPIVGQPITYTRYLIGGATVCCNPRWTARQGNGENPTQWTQSGGSTFTFTPQRPGDVVVGWDREAANHLLLAGYYDPPVRYRDSTPPIATAPAVRVTRGVIKGLVPVLIGWTATDKGWGVASYRLQRSVDGGAWTNVALKDPSSRSTIAWVPNKHLVRFRVRAVDKAGNVGTWATGGAFRPMNDPRTPVALSRTVPHP